MASILSTNLLEFILPIFIFLFIFAVLYAVLSKIKIFSDNAPLNSLIAFSLAILFIVIPEARQFIELAAPWFIVFVIAGLLLVMAFMILGVDPDFIKEVAKENAVVLNIIIGFTAFIFLFALSKAFGPGIIGYPGPEQTGITALVRRTLFNPKLLGLLVLLIIAAEVMRRVGFPTPVQKK